MCSVTERLAGVVRVGAKPASRLAGRCGGGKPAWNRCRGTGAKWFHPKQASKQASKEASKQASKQASCLLSLLSSKLFKCSKCTVER
jgi:hypothetical protein